MLSQNQKLAKSRRFPHPENQESRLPHNLEAERAVLGMILLDERNLHVVLEFIEPADFFSKAHRLIFETMFAMVGKVAIDLVTLANELSNLGLMESIGGAAYLAGLVDGLPIGSRGIICDYARIVKDKAALRKLVKLSSDVIAESTGGLEPSEEIIARAVSALTSVGQAEHAVEIVGIKDVITAAAPSFDRASGGIGVLYGTPTGFPQLDKKLGGWIAGEFVILGGRPSQGKTALVLEFIRRACLSGIRCLLISLETSGKAIAVRLICRQAQVSTHKFLTGYLTKAEWQRFTAALSEVQAWPLWVCGMLGLDAVGLRLKLESFVRHRAVGLVVVDYLQLLRAKAETRTQEVTEVSRQLKQVGTSLGEICGGTLIAVSQLSRIDADEKPRLHHLRESGQLEQDADTVLFVYDGETAKTGQDRPFKKILEIAKQRNGPTGLLPLTFFPEIIGFEECAVAAESEESS